MSSYATAASPPSPPDPGLCGMCRHVHKNETRRGTTYYRCTRAAWDDRLTKYPRLPVLSCPGCEPADWTHAPPARA